MISLLYKEKEMQKNKKKGQNAAVEHFESKKSNVMDAGTRAM